MIGACIEVVDRGARRTEEEAEEGCAVEVKVLSPGATGANVRPPVAILVDTVLFNSPVAVVTVVMTTMAGATETRSEARDVADVREKPAVVVITAPVDETLDT